ncbi:MAG: hypothetical protein ACPHJV_07240, partial [Miltoncostaeaceae bacterium]
HACASVRDHRRIVARMVTPALVGLDTATVQAAVDLRGGFPAFLVVGLPDAAPQAERGDARG